MDHTVQVQRITEAGCKPEDWLAYLSRLEMNPHLLETTNRYRALCNAYSTALKGITLNKNKANMAYAQICINFAKLKLSHDANDARMCFKYARANIKMLSIVHVEAAQFELDQGDKDKCLDILKKAANLKAEPQQLVTTALHRLSIGHTSLQSDEKCDPETTGEQLMQEPNGHSKPPVPSNYKRSIECTKPSSLTTQPTSILSTLPASTGQFSSGHTSSRQGQIALPGQPPRRPLSLSKRDTGSQDETPIVQEDVDTTVSFKQSAGDRKRQSSGASSFDDCDTISWLFSKTREVAARSVAPSGSVISQSACKPSRADISTPDCKNLPLFSSVSEASRRKNRPNYGQARRVKPTSLYLHYTTPTNPDDSDDDFPFPDIKPLEKTLPTYGNLGAEDPDVSHPKIIDPKVNDLRVDDLGVNDLGTTDKVIEPRTNDPKPTDSKVNDRRANDPRANDPKVERLTAILESPRQESNDSGVAMMETPSTEPQAPPTFKILSNSDMLQLRTPSNPYGKPNNMLQRLGGSLNQQIADKGSKQDVHIPNSKELNPVQSTKPQVPSTVPSLDAVRPPSQPSSSQNGSVYQNSAPLVQRKDIITVNKVTYKILKIIGKGGSSKVYQVFNEGKKKLLAIKYVSLDCADDMTVQSYINEISLLQKLRNSENIIHLYDFEITDSHIYLVMECGSIDLATFLSKHKKIDPQNMKFYWRGMLDAVDVVHQAGIIHSDLKPANFLFVEGTLKLIDFGIANAIQSDKTSIVRESQVGTLNYMSPEAIQDTSPSPEVDANGHRRPRLKINCKSDVWSLGCIFYYMVYGKTPFQHIKLSLVKLQAICDPKHIIEFPSVENPHLLDLLKKCLLRDPRQRPSIQDLKKHPYFQDKAPVVQNEKDSCQPSSLNLTEEHLKNIISQLSHPQINSPNSITAVSRTFLEQLQTGKRLDISTALKSKNRPFQSVVQQPPPQPPPPLPHQLHPLPLEHQHQQQRTAVAGPRQGHRVPLQVVQMEDLQQAQSALKPLCSSQSNRYMKQERQEKENRDLESVLRGQLAQKYQNAMPVTEEATYEQTWGTETLK